MSDFLSHVVYFGHRTCITTVTLCKLWLARVLTLSQVLGQAILPVVLVSKLVNPWVAQIRAQVPSKMLRSQRALVQFFERLPGDTRLEFVTLRTVPFRRTSAFRVRDLRAISPRFLSTPNIEVIPSARERPQGLAGKLMYWIREPRNYFQVADEKWAPPRRNSQVREAWALVLPRIREQSSPHGPASRQAK